MNVEEARKRLEVAGYRIGEVKRLGNEKGTQLRLENGHCRRRRGTCAAGCGRRWRQQANQLAQRIHEVA